MELADKAKIMQYKALIEKHMSDPVKLRLTTMVCLLVLAIGLVYMPISKKIDENKRCYAAEKERNSYIMDYEKLEKQAVIFRAYIGENIDSDKWVQYLLGGLRKFQIKLRGMESKTPRRVGPYQAVTFTMEIEGVYPELKNYVRWLESSKSLIRIDTIQLEKRSGNLLMKIFITGILPKNNAKKNK